MASTTLPGEPAARLGTKRDYGLSLVPWFVSPLILTVNGTFPSGQETNLPKVVLLIAFFGIAIVVAWRRSGPLAVHLRGLLAALPIFILFLSLLMVRHIPVVTGYYYGAIFASLFALLVGLLMAHVVQVVSWARPVTFSMPSTRSCSLRPRAYRRTYRRRSWRSSCVRRERVCPIARTCCRCF